MGTQTPPLLRGWSQCKKGDGNTRKHSQELMVLTSSMDHSFQISTWLILHFLQVSAQTARLTFYLTLKSTSSSSFPLSFPLFSF
jgi:hypothetical protein